MSDLADEFISALIQSGDTGQYLKLGDVQAVFEHTKSDQEIIKKFGDFLQRYGKIPEKETFEEILQRELPEAKETPDWYFDKLMDRHVHKAMLKATQIASDHLREKDYKKAFAEFQRMVESVSLQKMSPQIYDFRYSHDMMAHELRQKLSPEYGIELGWETLDGMTGGVRPGDLLSIVGRPSAGKSMMLLYNAMHAWEKQKKTPLFISMEMSPMAIFERLAALHQHIPYQKVKLGEFSTVGRNQKKQFLDGLLRMQRDDLPPFYVIDGNLTASIGDIINIAGHLHPDVVLVDGAYLVEAPGRKEHERIKDVLKGLKMQIATNMGTPVISSWQFNREATKVKKTEKAGMEHIAGSDAIPQMSSIALGMPQADSIQTAFERRIDILKGRGGESGSFTINWKWREMQFDEVQKMDDNKVYTA